jgi:hypothetical protein
MHCGLKMRPWHVFVLLAVQLSLIALRAAPPTNDGYSNRIAIAGSSMVITTSLSEATGEYYDWWRDKYVDSYRGSEEALPVNMGSLWWTASLTNPSSITIEFLEHSGVEQVAVWQHLWSDLCNCRLSGLRAVNNSAVGNVPYTTAVFTNGSLTDFDIQLTGPTATVSRVVLRFTIHTEPLILTPPANRTVSPGESVFFGVAATGHSTLRYQWLHNGEPMPGETFPVLLFTNVTAAREGSYEVMVMDDLGTNSAAATLTVSTENVAPRWRDLKRVSTEEWSGRLEVEAGRSYRIETSTNLIHWSPLTRLVQESSVRFGTSAPVSSSGVVFLAKTNAEISFKSSAPHQFFRAVRYEPVNSECHNHLKMFRFVKELWAAQHRKMPLNTPMTSELFGPDDGYGYSLYYKHKPGCPSDGVTTLGVLTSQPECNIHSPLLEPSW